MISLFVVFFAFHLIVATQQQSNKLLIGLGDSYTSGGGKQSYPLVAGSLLKWQAHNFAKGGSKMDDIPRQLTVAGALLSNATHIIFTTGGNDLGVGASITQIVVNNNFTAVANKAMSLKPKLTATYKIIKNAARPGTKIYALPYVDIFSVGNKTPNEADCHRMIDVLSNTIKAAAEEANIGFIEPVKTAFLGHEMFSNDPYSGGLSGPGAAHPNAKGYYRVGEVVAEYLKSQ